MSERLRTLTENILSKIPSDHLNRLHPDEMKKILMIAPTMKKGGMERQLATFLNSFDRDKLQITLALFNNDVEFSLPTDISIINLDKKKRPDIGFAVRLLKLVATSKYDLIDCKLSTISFPIMIICGLLRKSSLVIEVRSSGTLLIPFFKRFAWATSVFKQKWELIFNSRRALEQGKKYLPPNAAVVFIPNGIDSDRFKRKPVGKGEEFVVGYVGRILPLKNIETLINAIAHLRNDEIANIQLKVTGDIHDERYMLNLKSLINDLQIGSAVKFKTNVEAIEKEYSSIDLFVLPSFYEGTPNVLLEAMSCECPCLISRDANSDAFLDEDFVFVTTDFVELAEKIKLMYQTSQKQLEQIGHLNREYVLRNYSLQKMIDRLSDVLTKDPQ